MKRVAYVTDLHLDEAFPARQRVNTRNNWLRVLNDIKSENIADLIVGGDIGEPRSLPWFFSTLAGFSVRLTLGNHDQFAAVQKHLSQATAGPDELFHQTEDETFRYLFLDTSADVLSRQQMAWLPEALNTAKKIVLFMHHPVLPVDTKVDALYPLKNRGDVERILVESGREVTLFCGHYHLAHEQQKGGIRQIISPAVSFQMVQDTDQVLVDGRHFGYRILSFGDDGGINTTEKQFINELAPPGATLPG